MRILLSLATAITILAVALVLLLTPVWMHFALRTVGGGDAIFATPQLAADASDRTVNELLFGPGTFAFEGPGGSPMYTPDEASHLRDARVVLYLFLGLATASLVFVGVTIWRAPRDSGRWYAIGRGGLGLAVGVVALGIFAALAFDAAFTLFHEVFFPGGNWAFPPDSNMIRLYTEPFFELSAFTLGGLAALGGLIVWFLARRRASALTAA